MKHNLKTCPQRASKEKYYGLNFNWSKRVAQWERWKSDFEAELREILVRERNRKGTLSTAMGLITEILGE